MKKENRLLFTLDDYTVSVLNQYKNKSELVRLLVRLLTNQDKKAIVEMIAKLKR